MVYLQVEGEKQRLNTRTDSEGTYRFLGLRAGLYSLRAEAAGYSQATLGPFPIAKNEAKQIDIKLEPAKASLEQSSSGESSPASEPQFFDQPNFTVAGVTDAGSPGGHGASAVLRSSEALAKATVSLSRGSPSPVPTAPSATLSSLRAAIERDPDSFDTNSRLGALLVDEGKARDALPYLERAFQRNPGDYPNAYELALAYADTGAYEIARSNVRTLLARQDRAELHHLLGDVEEKLNNPLAAVHEYQRAAELDPSEPDLFDWGAELLIHRALDPAGEVFSRGNQRFPSSTRMLLGLAAASYARGSYAQAAEYVCKASDLSPDDPNPYLFMGKMQSVETTGTEAVAERLARFARLQPENALASYYYAVNLWRRRKGPDDARTSSQVESLLQKAVDLDPKLGAAYLQLGIVYSEQKDLPKAISAYQKATDAAPGMEEAHYRLAQAYRQIGESVKAQQELQLYERAKKKAAGQADRERHEIQQFVYTLRSSAKQP